MNALARTKENSPDDDTFWLFKISFMYYALIGCATVWIVGLPISLIWKTDQVVDEKLLAPFLRQKQNSSVSVKYTSSWLFSWNGIIQFIFFNFLK